MAKICWSLALEMIQTQWLQKKSIPYKKYQNFCAKGCAVKYMGFKHYTVILHLFKTNSSTIHLTFTPYLAEVLALVFPSLDDDDWSLLEISHKIPKVTCIANHFVNAAHKMVKLPNLLAQIFHATQVYSKSAFFSLLVKTNVLWQPPWAKLFFLFRIARHNRTNNRFDF